MGINWTNNQKSPNKVSLSSSLPVSFFYATQTTISSSTTTLVVPTNYDVGGTITALPGAGGTATNQRIYQFPTGAVVVQYGQTSYNNLTRAIAGTQTENFVKHPATFGSAVLIGILSITKNCTNISDTTRARFTPASAFGEVTGGTSGISTTTLQQAYDNSTQPEIVIDATLDGVTIKNGTGNADNVTHLLEGQNTAGTVTSFIMADGTFHSAYSVVDSISGANGNIVTHDADGKLLDSGILATDLATNSQVASISGDLQSQISAITIPTSATFLSDYDARYVNITGDTMTGNLIITSDNSSPALQINSDGDARIRLNNPSGGDIYSELAFATDGADVIGLYLGTDGYFSIYDYINNVDRFRFGPAATEIKAQDDTSILYGEGDEGYIIINSDRGNTDTYISTSNVERALIVNSSIDAINENVRVGITNDASISGSGAFQVDGGASITKNLVVGGIAGTSGNIVTHDANGKLLDSGVNIDSISTKTIGFVIDGGTSVPVSGTYASIVAPFSGTISKWTIITDVSGSATLDIWKANGAKPTNANSITASAKPTITSSEFATSSTLTGWTTSIVTGDVLTVELETIDIIKRITIQLEVTI
jgi:hypothetical protein